ncbi:phage tail protein [Bordetella genomosp. 13]|uniref:phage tail protein n=1 Tax=Bordetella genomosp. 13 TaxID=463040 RepID=UPI00119F016E|nr:phage tail protein [Bordetella genomosp. 13]
MSVFLSNGSTISIAGTLGAEKIVTAVTNASPGVASSTGHGFVNGGIVLVRSGWTSLDSRVARVAASEADKFSLDGIDTTNVRRYPAGGGAGGARLVTPTSWTEITQITESSASGGEQQFATYSFLADTGDQRQLPTKRTPRQITLQVADDAAQPHYAILDAADSDRLPRVIRLSLPNGAVIYYAAYISFNKVPTMNQDEIMVLAVNLSLASEPTRYAS